MLKRLIKLINAWNSDQKKKTISEILRGDSSTDHTDIKYIRRYYEQIYASNLENLNERVKVLENYSHQNWHKRNRNSKNLKSQTTKKIVMHNWKPYHKETPDSESFTRDSYQKFNPTRRNNTDHAQTPLENGRRRYFLTHFKHNLDNQSLRWTL